MNSKLDTVLMELVQSCLPPPLNPEGGAVSNLVRWTVALDSQNTGRGGGGAGGVGLGVLVHSVIIAGWYIES